MLATSDITTGTNTILLKLPFMSGITSETDHARALALIDELVENYDENIVLIEALSYVIDRYENECIEFAYFNQSQNDMDPVIATLKTLMDQYGLSISDFVGEIGNKSMVVKVLVGKSNLSCEQIKKLAKHFDINPGLFF